MTLAGMVGDSMTLLVTGWIVVTAGTVGVAAAAGVYGLQMMRPGGSPRRRYRLVVTLFFASLAVSVGLVLIPPVVQARAREVGQVAGATAAAVTASPRADLRTTGVSTLRAGTGVRATVIGVVVPVLGGLWVALTVIVGLRLAGGVWLIRRIRRRSTPCGSPEVQQAADRIGRQLGLARPVPIHESVDVGTPVTAGWRQPLVLLPVGLAAALRAGEIELLLAHELSHVKRNDFVAGMAQAVADVVTPLSPGHRWLSNQARTLREEACDATVLESGAEPLAYAAALERVAQWSTGRPMGLPVCAANARVAERIRRLVTEDPPAEPARIRVGVSVAAMLIAALGSARVTVAAGESTLLAASRAQGVELVPNPMAEGARAIQMVSSSGFLFDQPGSPVRIQDTKASRAFAFNTVTVKDTFPKGIVSVTFGAFVDPQFKSATVSLTRSNPIAAAIEPGKSQTLQTALFPVSRLPEVHALGPQGVLMLAVIAVSFEDGTSWTAPIDDNGSTYREMLRIPQATVPRSFVSPASVPPQPGTKPVFFCYYGESEIDVMSQGGVMPIANEPNKLATCINGRWVEGVHDLQR